MTGSRWADLLLKARILLKFKKHLMQKRTRMYARVLLALASSAIAGLSHAQETAIPDIGLDVLSNIARELECGRPAAPNAILGCEILAQFSAAGSPDPEVLKTSSGAGGRRWMEVTVISDKSRQPRESFQSSSPFQVLVVPGARYSSNFHQKLYVENGDGYSYIWPNSAARLR